MSNAKEMSCLKAEVLPERNLGTITFTRPSRLNSFIDPQYGELYDALEWLAREDAVRVVYITGSGKFYSSGHDLGGQAKGMMKVQQEDGDLRSHIAHMTRKNAFRLVRLLIDYEKPIVAGVNGPALGIACTSLALFDVVYASESAFFHTPFMQFAFCAEGCSSVMFPRIMGDSVANEMLLLGRKLTAREAKEVGFVSDTFPTSELPSKAFERACAMAAFPPNALKDTKRLVRDPIRQELHDTNEREISLLIERFLSAECAEAVMKFMMERQQKRSKL